MLLYEENSRWKHLSDKIKAYLMTSGNFATICFVLNGVRITFMGRSNEWS